MYKIKILILFLTIKSLNLSCSEGCLQCTESKTCSLCDPFDSYYLKNYKCYKSETKCEQLSPNNQCKLCPPKHYLDPNSNICLEVRPINQTENCFRYSNLLSCLECIEGFYLLNNKCVIPEIGITNCVLYKNKEECLECVFGFVPSIDSKSCVYAFSGNNCLFYDFVECGECFSGYKKNESKYIVDFFKNEGEKDWGVMERVFLKKWGKIEVNFCSKIIVENCKEVEQFDKCFRCNEGFFLDSNFRCQENPIPKIENCYRYLNKNHCEECEGGFFKKFEGECKQNTIIQGCTLYSGFVNPETTCLKCEKSDYLYSNTCNKRVNLIDHCEEHEIHHDKCSKCGFDKQISSDGLKCFEKVLNCEEYSISTKSDTELICSKCLKGYYFHQTFKKCQKGTISNCVHYFHNMDKCSICDTKYYLENEKCISHSEFPNCSIYNETKKDECSYCKNGFIIVKHTNGCVRVENIKPGCIAHKNANECEECDKDYFLTNQNTCDLIPLSSNCVIYNESGCDKCKEDYILDNKKCFLPLSIFVDNCLRRSINGSHSFVTAKCDVCSKGSFPYNLKGQFFCLENWRRKNILDQDIAYCKRYSFENNSMLCKECEENYWLQDDGTCADKNNCALAYLPFKKYNLYEKIEKRNLCTNIATGCILGALNNKNMNSIECAKCDYLTHIQKIKNFEDSDNFIPYNNYSISSTKSPALSPVSYYPRIECVKKDDSSIFNNNLIENCELYGDIGNDKIGCLKCKHGFSGLLENESDIGYIKSCINMSSCEDKEYFGLPRDISILASCTRCKNPDEIPFIFINAAPFYHKILGLLAYDENHSKVAQGGLSIKCLKKNAASLNLNTLNLPSRCSLAIFNINSIKDASESNKVIGIDKTKIAAFCVSCEPSWRPIKGIDSTGQEIKNYVGKCEEIANCKFSDGFNNCSECENGFVYQFINGHGIAYNICIDYDKDFFCLAIDITDPSKPICKVCKKGYFLNLDKICESITFSKCDGFEPILKLSEDIYRTWNFLFYEIEGCNKCENGFDLFLKLPNEDFNVCYLSQYVNNRPLSYIPHCVDYYADLDVIKCYRCDDGFTKDRYEITCINQEKSNCLKLDKNTHKCVECTEETVIVNGLCEKKNKENCSNYSSAESNSEVICINCNEGFFLVDNKCEKGKIDNCAEYNTDGSDCLNCMDNFIIGKIVDGKNYCIKIDTYFGCKKFNSINVDQLTCSACDKEHFLTSEDLRYKHTSCLEINIVLNCKLYDVGQKFNKSSFKCMECDFNFYLEDNLCKRRTITDMHCEEFSKTKNSCYKCKGRWFTSESGACKPNPIGIKYCTKYANNTSCLTCSSEAYLKNNICVKINKQIENCEEYESELYCRKCNFNYILLNHKCVKSEAINCLTYLDSTTCEKCHNHFGLKIEGGIKSCIFKNHVPNCKKSENLYPFTCLECLNQTILNEKNLCVPPLLKIENCEEYLKEGTCKKCTPTSILNENGTKCILIKQFEYNIDKKCKVNYKLKHPVCRICEKGFYLFLGECLKCNVYNCAICDFERNGNECIMCDLGYYMDETGKCIFKNNDKKIDFVNFASRYLLSIFIVFFLVFK